MLSLYPEPHSWPTIATFPEPHKINRFVDAGIERRVQVLVSHEEPQHGLASEPWTIETLLKEAANYANAA